MLLTCNNKGCLKSSEAALDLQSYDVICRECGKSISNISESMKRALKSFGQILRTDNRKAFMMGCKSCNANREVVLDDKNNTICKICSSEIKVQPAMRQALIAMGHKVDKDSDEKSTNSKKSKKNK